MVSGKRFTEEQVLMMLEEESGGETELDQYESDLDVEVRVLLQS